MVCEWKETATLPRLVLVNTVPSMCPTASATLPKCEVADKIVNREAANRKLDIFHGRNHDHESGRLTCARVEPGRPHGWGGSSIDVRYSWNILVAYFSIEKSSIYWYICI
jgi:hypothetical protein